MSDATDEATAAAVHVAVPGEVLGPATGRRERNKREKRDRILAAATALFEERGFENVTTQQIADRADIGAGTLFRYAASKGELFLMVYNARFAAAVSEGETLSALSDDPASAVCALVEPVLVWAAGFSDSADYQRALLFGAASEPYRAEGLAVVKRLEDGIAARLVAYDGATVRPQDAARAARSVFAILNLLLVQPLNELHPDTDPRRELRAQITQIVAGLLAEARATSAQDV